jgi:hypothetical protein
VELVRRTKMLGRLPVVNFAAGGVATPADAALMMQVQLLNPVPQHAISLQQPAARCSGVGPAASLCHCCCSFTPTLNHSAACRLLMTPLMDASHPAADGHGRRVRGLWHLQVWRRRQARPRHRAGVHLALHAVLHAVWPRVLAAEVPHRGG